MAVANEKAQELLAEEEADRLSLADAITQLQAIDRQRDSKAKLDALLTVIAKLSEADRDLIANNETVMAEIEKLASRKDSGLRPGDPIYDKEGRHINDVPYSMSWCQENMECLDDWTVPINPNGTNYWQVSWNGVEALVYCEDRLGTKNTNDPAKRVPVWVKTQIEASLFAERRAYSSARAAITGSPHYAADGAEVAVGWYKASDDELRANPMNRER
ncbi:MAG: hypothetical protein KGL39_46440 [Patescibacteria group bacterium]|nr:hypothetical protein [Patescibacteria group bacterium]